MANKGIAILGSTGSIGVNTLKVIAQHTDRFTVKAMAAGKNYNLIIEQAKKFKPSLLAMADKQAAQQAKEALSGSGVEVLSGDEGMEAVATHADVDLVVSAIVGASGLKPTLAAVRAGKNVALANKECLVMAGGLFKKEVARYNTHLIPVDSEHSAIFQVLGNLEEVRSIVLTASGGPFRGFCRQQLVHVTPENALAHPRWRMGRKISIDSATMMNKGLEIMEAHWLFDLPLEQIKVVIHPESVIHSLVEYWDGSSLAQLGLPDMCTPIAVALAWPKRIAIDVERLDLVKVGKLTFEEPDEKVFPCLRLARSAMVQGGTAPVILNAANEVAVDAFLAGQITFLQIPELLQAALMSLGTENGDELETILATDQQARSFARQWIDHRF